MAFQRRRGYSGRDPGHPEHQRETRSYGRGGGGGGYGRGGGGYQQRGGDRRESNFLFQHRQEPVQYAENGFTVVSSYAFPANERFPEPRAFIDIRDFFYSEQQNGGQFLCATSRGCKIPYTEARELLHALQAEIEWLETTHPGLCNELGNDSQKPPEDEVPF